MKIEKVENLVANLHNKKEYFIHIRNLKQALNHGLVLKKVHGVIKFNKKTWRKSYTDMNTELTKYVKNNFEKDFFKLVNHAVFGNTKENIRNLRDIKLTTIKARRNYLVSKFSSNRNEKNTNINE